MNDPVYVVIVDSPKPFYAGICPRAVAEFWKRHRPDRVKISELDPKIKSEYKKFLSIPC
jgi:hypothetical protein